MGGDLWGADVAKTTHKLTTRGIQAFNEPGRYPDGGGLYLDVTDTGSKSWVYRFMLNKRSREMGLGRFPDVGLAEARKKAEEARRQRAEGIDPIDARKEAERVARLARSEAMTFQKAAEAYIDAHEASWRNAKHAAQWKSTLEAYVYPQIGDLDVAKVDTDVVLACLEPIWRRVPETASRVRGRIETVLDWAKARRYRDGPNPAVWRGHLSSLLPAPRKVRKGKHFPSLPYGQIGAFMAALTQLDGMGRHALEFIILTAARSTEVREMTWGELEPDGVTWVRPEERMKGGVAHRVALSQAATELLDTVARMQGFKNMAEARDKGADKFVFGSKRGKALSDMTISAVIRRMNDPDPVWVDPMQGRSGVVPHGFRATFRTWVAEQTDYSRDLAEAALAHTEGDKVVAAYQRGPMLEKRRKLMEDWAEYCSSPLQIMKKSARRTA